MDETSCRCGHRYVSFRANSGTRIEDHTNNAKGRELSEKTTYFPRADSDPYDDRYDDRYDVLSMIRADRDHSVISYVKRLPFESTSYPATRYLGKKNVSQVREVASQVP